VGSPRRSRLQIFLSVVFGVALTSCSISPAEAVTEAPNCSHPLVLFQARLVHYTGLPMARLWVQPSESESVTQTDVNGFFSFCLPTGKHRITVYMEDPRDPLARAVSALIETEIRASPQPEGTMNGNAINRIVVASENSPPDSIVVYFGCRGGKDLILRFHLMPDPLRVSCNDGAKTVFFLSSLLSDFEWSAQTLDGKILKRKEELGPVLDSNTPVRYLYTWQKPPHVDPRRYWLLIGLIYDRLRPKVIGVSGRVIHAAQSNSSAFIDSGSDTGFFNGQNLFDIHTPTANTQAISWPSACLGASWRPERPKHWGWPQREICTFTLPADLEIQWREMPLGMPALFFNRMEHPPNLFLLRLACHDRLPLLS
jgi:hypothetical protein